MPSGWRVSGSPKWNASVGMVYLHLAGRALASVSLFGKMFAEVLGPSSRKAVGSVSRARMRGCSCPHLRVKKAEGSAFQPPPRPAGLLASRGAEPPSLGPRPPSHPRGVSSRRGNVPQLE